MQILNVKIIKQILKCKNIKVLKIKQNWTWQLKSTVLQNGYQFAQDYM